MKKYLLFLTLFSLLVLSLVYVVSSILYPHHDERIVEPGLVEAIHLGKPPPRYCYGLFFDSQFWPSDGFKLNLLTGRYDSWSFTGISVISTELVVAGEVPKKPIPLSEEKRKEIIEMLLRVQSRYDQQHHPLALFSSDENTWKLIYHLPDESVSHEMKFKDDAISSDVSGLLNELRAPWSPNGF